MRKEIEIKYLAPYLPYKLKAYTAFRNGIDNPVPLTIEVDAYNVMNFVNGDTSYRIVLRPLSDLQNPVNGIIHANILYRQFDMTDLLFNGHCENPKYGYEVYEYLISYHFDVFGLIELGLAIDINTI